MDKKTIIGILLFATTLFYSGLTVSQAALDQFQGTQNKYFATNSSFNMAQTVSVGMDGWLDTVSIYMQESPMGAAADLVFQIRPSLDGSVIYQDILTNEESSDEDEWKIFDIRSSNLWFNQDDTFAITLDVIPDGPSASFGWLWWGGQWLDTMVEASYTRGTAYSKDLGDPTPTWEAIPNSDFELTHGCDLFDFAFQTDMDPDPIPIPSAFWLLGSGLIGVVRF